MVTCPVCGTVFPKKTKDHMFCKRRCFKIDYARRKREEKNDESHFPQFCCPDCGKITQLDFNVKKEPGKWIGFHCPHCAYQNELEF